LVGTCRRPCAVLHKPMGRSMRSRQSTRLNLRVPAVYLTSAILAFSAFVATCRINKLQPVNLACGFESHPLRQTSCFQLVDSKTNPHGIRLTSKSRPCRPPFLREGLSCTPGSTSSSTSRHPSGAGSGSQSPSVPERRTASRSKPSAITSVSCRGRTGSTVIREPEGHPPKPWR